MFDIEGSLRVVAAMVCKLIYKLIALIYELFMTIARVNILSSEEIAPIYQRVTMILTIVMVFYITFEFVKYVVQPDTINDKEKGAGNVALKMIVVILLIAFVPRIFTMAYDLQGRIIDNQAISKIILGNTNIDSNMGTYGRAFAADVLSVFYKVNEEVCNGCEEGNIVNYNLNRLVENGDLKYLTTNLKEYEKVKNPVTNENEDIPIIDFDGGLAIIVGALIIYILVLYCIDVGTRYAQLIFLQVISPVAIMGYLTPKKDNMFTKWLKQCTTTYIDLFIRIAIIYFILLICQVLGDAYGSGKLFEGLGEISAGLKMFTYIALILGLLLFANKAPKMLQELFPSSGAAGIGYGLRTPSQVFKDAPLLSRGVGAVYAGGGSFLKNARKSFGKVYENLKEGKEGKKAEAFKWFARGTVGGVGAAISGAYLGLGSSSPSNWGRALKIAYDRRQSRYKIHDAGYKPIGKGGKRWWSDQARKVLLMDEHIEDMSSASDLAVQSLQERITRIQQSGTLNEKYRVFKSKATKEFILYDKDGTELARSKDEDAADLLHYNGADLSSNIELAKLNAELGKEQGKNKALHQKENENKDKK